MTQNMTPEQERSASSSRSQPLDGEIVGLEDERVRVRLETGVIGFLTGIAGEEIQSTFKLGQYGSFRIERRDKKGEALLSLVSTQASEAPQSFEHDVDRLQDALNNHHATPIRRDEVIPTMDEQRIQQWLNRVESSLEKLRKNRAKRLDEEFYSGS
ncbi:MAG: hypothetical protein V3T03_02275 [Candidatus Bipolaricaulota bacterium]